MDLSYAAGDLSGLMRELRDHAPAAKLLLLSVHDEPTVVAAAIAAGADGLVLKRAIGRDLMPAIDALLAGQRYFDSSLLLRTDVFFQEESPNVFHQRLDASRKSAAVDHHGGAVTARSGCRAIIPEDIPVTWEEQTQKAVDCYNAGATVLHLHVRDPKTGHGSKNFNEYADCIGRLRKAVPKMIIQIGGSISFAPHRGQLRRIGLAMTPGTC